MVIEREYFTIKLTSKIDLGVALTDLKTVIQLDKNICAVPGVAEFWYGVINFKGSLLWVLDSDRFFQLQTASSQPPQKLIAIVIHNPLKERKQVAVVTSQLKGIVAIDPANIEAVDDDPSSMLDQCCSAVADTQASQIYLLDSTVLLERLHQNSMLVPT